MRTESGGFLLVDVMVAATVLALMVGAASGLMSARGDAVENARRRDATAACLDESIYRLAAERELTSGNCGDLHWTVERRGDDDVWSVTRKRVEALSVALPAR